VGNIENVDELDGILIVGFFFFLANKVSWSSVV
jgi:hypothetical protein